MANARFLLTNLASTATVKNGTGGSPTPPARSEEAPFTMERALNGDRRSLWKANAANDVLYFGTDYQLDLDLGSVTSVSAVHIGGMSCPGGAISSLEVGYFASYPSSTAIVLGTVNFSSGSFPRDYTFTFNSVSARYLYVWIGASASPVIGNVFPAEVLDVGAAPNFGSQTSHFRNRIEQQLEDGSVLINELGYEGADFSLNFSPVLEATWTLLRRLEQASGTIVYVDPDNVGYEVYLKGGRVNVSKLGGGLFSVSFELGRCP